MREVTRYSTSIKESFLTKSLGANGPSVVELAREFNIPLSTAYTWIRMNKDKNDKILKNEPSRSGSKSASEKLQAIFDTLNKTDEERGAYCREHGIFPHHLDEWQEEALKNALQPSSTKQSKAELQKVLNEVNRLKGDLHRKDKALAEVSALLILKKKADLLWGVEEED